MRLHAVNALLLGVSAAMVVPAQAPKPPEQEEMATIQVEVDVVNLLCSVRDKNGGLVGNLDKDDFRVFEAGKEQQIKYFTRETDLPLTLGLLVDVSGSQANLINVERRAAEQFFDQVLRKKDMAFLISFGSDAELLQDFTNSRSLLNEGLSKLQVVSSVGGINPGPVPTMSQQRGTILFDAVYLAANERLKGEVGRKAIVLITDGVDMGSRVKRDEAIEAAQKANAIIYSIYYVDPSAYYGGGFFHGYSDSDLKKMSEETGGRVLKVDKKHTLQDIFREIQDELRSQYAIGYTPSEGRQPGEFREVEIKTSDKKLKVNARKGYYVPTKR